MPIIFVGDSQAKLIINQNLVGSRCIAGVIVTLESDNSLSQRATRIGNASNIAQVGILPPPSANGRLVDHEEIGRGGMGVVWRAKDTRLFNRLVAVKRVLPDLEDYGAIVLRFQTEAKALATLKHPNIVDIYSLGQDQIGAYIEMEYVDGPNLQQHLDVRTVLPLDEAIRLTRKVCEALHFAHGNNIIHRDIKPSNVLLTSQGVPKLTDFGLAQIAGNNPSMLVTQSGRILGTEGYMAPEQTEDAKNASAASDQYSLAATLYQMVTGRSPRTINFRYLPDPIRQILEQALEERPSDRFRNVAAFHEALGAVLRQRSQANSTSSSESNNTSSKKDLSKMLQVLLEQVEQCHVDAKQLFAKYEDSQVLDVLAKIPEHLRDRTLEENSRTRLNLAQKLEVEIRNRVQSLKLDGIRPLIEQYISIYPHRKDMHELLKQLPGETTAQIVEPGISSEPVVNEPKKPAARPAQLMAPFSPRAATEAQFQWAAFLDRPVEYINSIGMKFRLIPPGEFLMGASAKERDAREHEKPQHRVRITQPFYLGVHPVSQAAFQQIVGTNPSRFKNSERLPVEQVAWEDAQLFSRELSAIEPSSFYRLPTEAEWEYACRAGTTTPFWFGTILDGKQANCDGNNPYGRQIKGKYLQSTCEIGSYPANPFGIYDQHGQVREWCHDWYAPDYYKMFEGALAIDPQGPESGFERCLRGGSWFFNAADCRAASRSHDFPGYRCNSIGFRLVCIV